MVLVVKNLNEGDLRDMDSIPRSGRSPGGGHDRVQQTHLILWKNLWNTESRTLCSITSIEHTRKP